jgi:hypothetical protein
MQLRRSFVVQHDGAETLIRELNGRGASSEGGDLAELVSATSSRNGAAQS